MFGQFSYCACEKLMRASGNFPCITPEYNAPKIGFDRSISGLRRCAAALFEVAQLGRSLVIF
jgi:hypothetical protein